MPSLYAQYMEEREDIKTIETDDGFLTYKALPSEEHPEEFRIFDLYVVPHKRKSGIASELADQVATIARERDCRILTGSVDTRNNGATRSTKVLLSYGFRLLRNDGPMIYFIKELN